MPMRGSDFGALSDEGIFINPPNGSLRRRNLLLIVLASSLVICWYAAEIHPSVLFSRSAGDSIWRFVRSAFPPDLSPSFLLTVLNATGQTIAIAIVGTILSILIGLPLGILSTATLWERGILVANRRKGFGLLIMKAVSHTVRAVLGFLRAVPDLVWGLMFVVAVGLGSLAGTLALAVSYSGVLGRVYANVFEDVDPLPLEALQSTGATRAQIFLRGIWPQARPSVIGYTLYSFDCSVRAASVLGFVGAGGLGYEVYISMRLFEYGQVLTLIAAFIVLIAATDAFSRFVRQQLSGNGEASLKPPDWLVPLSGESATRQRSVISISRYLVGAIAAIVLIWSIRVGGFDLSSLASNDLFVRIGRFIGSMFPPDIHPAFIQSLGRPLLQTIGISVIGTLIGVAIGSVLALPATATLVFADAGSNGKHSLFERLLGWSLYLPTRLILNALRSVPEMVWVLLCILVAGLGPFAGTLAIGVHTGGVLGRLYAETLEEVPVRPIEALRASGAGPLQILIWGIWPQARSLIASYTILRWEANLRVSTILGLVGGGGLGQIVYNNIQLGFYQRVATLIIVIYGLVMLTDWIGDRCRARLAT